MSAGPNTAPVADWAADDDKAAGIERRAYVQGWWWGFASGLICGAASTAMLVWLLWLVACALGGSTC